ncbi:MAG: hypothetical protein QXO71_05620, partial [Candidatus Jordarchaeaceae archaeon]
MQRQSIQEDYKTVIQYIHQHLTSMWRNVKEASYEIQVREDSVGIYFYAHHCGFRGEKCFKEAWKKINSLKISLETRFPNIETKIQEFDELKKVFKLVDINSKIRTKKDFIISQTDEGEIWISVIQIKGRIENTPHEKYSQIDNLIWGLTKLGMDANFIV